MKAGLNLYSIRNYLDTEEKFTETAKKLSEMGYSYMQFSGAPFNAEMIARVSEKSGLPVVLTHVPMDRIINDTEALYKEHELFGCKYIGLGSMPTDAMTDKKRCFEIVDALEDAAVRIEKLGGKFFYHHHHREFYKFDGETIFDYIVKNAPHIHFTLDTYWLQYGGVDVCDTIDRLAGRIECLHLKDYMIAVSGGEKKNFAPVYAPVGSGNQDFKKIVKHAAAAGCEYYLVEQDNAAILPDTLGQVESSIKYIINEL